MSAYFSQKKEDATTGKIEVFGQRYILVRAASMSVDFFDTIKGMFKDWGEDKASEMARSLLFDFAHTIGKMDARNFHQRMGLQDPIEKLSAGPIHFSHTGWAFVDISAESKPTADENYYLIYDHPFSFEADSWEKSGKKSSSCVCAMNAGYSSGWCEESFGIPLVASEIMCKARGDSACRFIMAHPRKMAQYLQAYLRSHPEISDNATIYRTGGFFRQLKQTQDDLRKSEERFKQIAVNAGDWIWEVNAEGLYTYSSPIAETVLGYKPEEIVGKKYFYDFFAPEVKESLKKAAFDAFNRRESFIGFVNPLIHKNGSTIIMETTGTPVLDDKGEFCGYRGIDRNITERKNAEKSLEKLNADLKTTVSKLIRSNRHLHEFAHLTAHDLKTPLRGISTLAQWLLTDYYDKFDDNGRKQLDLLAKRIRRVDKLMNAILEYSTTDRNKHNERLVNFNGPLREAILQAKPPENIEITVIKQLPALLCEEKHIYQVFYNIINNAVRFMDKKEGHITIDCTEEEKQWRFSISDNGPGIERKYFDRIFQLFQALDEDDDNKGVGAGLTITQKIVELYDGKIWLTSEPGKGSTFFFTWPKAQATVSQKILQTATI
ncbi:MAG: PAS domain S-box protein [Sedimentisphaerales bacterium]|nr:PAS domain S-box protein [Sedimentisphaerales bacterium]